jgi:HSP20 family molecular chaperone IbpA
MPQVTVNKVSEPNRRNLPIFEEFENLADRIRLKAYNLFARRGSDQGHALDDWLAAERAICWPAAELTESEGQYTLKVALPGFAADEVDITATAREVLIKATRQQEKSGGDKQGELRWSEFKSNEVFRRVEMPGEIAVDKVAASLKDGMLEITAPQLKSKATSRRKVELSTPS